MYLTGYHALKLAPADLALALEIPRGQFAISAARLGGTSFEFPSVFGDRYAYDGRLGLFSTVRWASILSLWALAAGSETLLFYGGSEPVTVLTPAPMTLDPLKSV